MPVRDNRFINENEAFDSLGNLILGSVSTEQGGLTEEQRIYYRTRPVEFSKDILGNDPWDMQEKILQSVADNERTTVRSSHGIGKTFNAAEIVLWFCSSFFPSTTVTTAPTARQVEDVLWREINARHGQAKVPLGGKMLTTNWEMSREKKWFATGFTTEKHSLERFQGFHNDNILVVVEEASGVETPIFDAIEGLLSAGRIVRLLLIGNPTNENTEFGKSFKSPLYNKLYMSAFNSPNFTELGITEDDIKTGEWRNKNKDPLPRFYLIKPSWVAGRYTAWGEDNPLYQVRVKGEFPKEGEDTFISLAWVERSYSLTIEDQNNEEKILGVDIAGLGRDDSVAYIRQGREIIFTRIWHHYDPMENVGMVSEIINEQHPNKVNIDAVGEGSGVVSRLRELGYAVNGINMGESASKTKEFFNLRSELYWTLREMLRSSYLKIPEDEMLENDLVSGLKKDPMTSKGQLKLETKDKTKTRLGRSPDRADALALTMFGGESIVLGEMPQSSSIAVKDREKIYHNIDFVYNVIRRCPMCRNIEGIIFLDDCEMVPFNKATRAKCIICNKIWNIEELIGGE